MKIIPKSMKRRLKEMRGPILEQMSIEQAFQADLRTAMVRTTDEQEIARTRVLFNESVRHWEGLAASLQEYNELSKGEWKISPDTVLVVAGNLLGILLILTYEKADIITSKAINFILKGRV